MTRYKYVEVANFICKFGDKNLLDLLEEVVLPAFNSNEKRSYGTTNYFLHQVKLVEIKNADTPIWCFTGRFIKNTLLQREQIFDEGRKTLVSDKEEMPSALSSIFVLILNNHRLIYLGETHDSPSISMFSATMKGFLKESHRNYIDRLYQQRDNEEATKKTLLMRFPYPRLEIIPLATEESLDNFINEYDTLQSITIQLVETNNQLDNNGLFVKLRESGNAIDSKNITLTYKNNDGLAKEDVSPQLAAAVGQGNSHIKLKGKDREGNELNGSNQEFNIQLKFQALMSSAHEAVAYTVDMLRTASKHVLEGIRLDEEKEQKLRTLFTKESALELDMAEEVADDTGPREKSR
jgi:hypothetical protein